MSLIPCLWWNGCFFQGAGQLNVTINRWRYLLISTTSRTSVPINTSKWFCLNVRYKFIEGLNERMQCISHITTEIQSHNICVIRMDVIWNLLAFFFFEEKKETFLHSCCVRQRLLTYAKIYIRNTYYRDDSTPSTYFTNVHRMNKKTHRRRKFVLLMYSNRNTNHYLKVGR